MSFITDLFRFWKAFFIFPPQAPIKSAATQPATQIDMHCKHSTLIHMPLAKGCIAHHLPKHPLHSHKIITNPRPFLMPYNCVLFKGALLLHVVNVSMIAIHNFAYLVFRGLGPSSHLIWLKNKKSHKVRY